MGENLPNLVTLLEPLRQTVEESTNLGCRQEPIKEIYLQVRK
jgi:hypothetical protein